MECHRLRKESATCRKHPNFYIDTICFHPDCAVRGEQLLCFHCVFNNDTHKQHRQYLEAIHYRTPGFRMIESFHTSHHRQMFSRFADETMEQIREKVNSIQAEIEDYVNRQRESNQCLIEFFDEDAVLKIVNKIKERGAEHKNCCLKVLSNLRDIELEKGDQNLNVTCEELFKQLKRRGQKMVEKLNWAKMIIAEFLRKEYKELGEQNPQKIEEMPVQNPVLVDQKKEQKEIQAIQQLNSPRVEEKNYHNQHQSSSYAWEHENVDIIDVDDENQSYSPVKCLKIEEESRYPNTMKQHQSDNEEGQPNMKESSYVSENQQQNDSKGERSIQIKHPHEEVMERPSSDSLDFICDSTSSLLPYGTERVSKSLYVLWNAANLKEEILKYLNHNPGIEHIIIEDSGLAHKKFLQTLLERNPCLKGLHLHCDHDIGPQLISGANLEAVSYLPSYRFMQQIDTSKYFMRNKMTKTRGLHPDLYKTVLKNTKIKNAIITDRSSVFRLEHRMEEVSLGRNWKQEMLHLETGMVCELIKCPNLAILAFAHIYIDRKVNFRKIFQANIQLHTLVFDSCQANMQQIVLQFSHVNKSKLRHLQISSDDQSSKKIELTQKALKEIFSCEKLEILILQGLDFTERNGEIKDSGVFGGLKNLQGLKYVNLYESQPVYNDILQHFHPNCYKTLKSLNLGCSELRPGAEQYLRLFTQLQSLSIEYTMLGEAELLAITERMEELERLSLENLNGKEIVYEEQGEESEEKYGNISLEGLRRVGSRGLRYVNIYHCNQLADYDWKEFPHLECLRVSQGMLSPKLLEELRNREVRVYEAQEERAAPSSLPTAAIQLHSEDSASESDSKKRKQSQSSSNRVDGKQIEKGRNARGDRSRGAEAGQRGRRSNKKVVSTKGQERKEGRGVGQGSGRAGAGGKRRGGWGREGERGLKLEAPGEEKKGFENYE